MLAAAARPITAAAMARPVSRPLTAGRRTTVVVVAAGRGAGVAAGAGGRVEVAGAVRTVAAVGAPGAAVGGRGAAVAGAWVEVAGAAGAGVAAGAAPPPGRLGSLIVAVGLGGKLMRTVSFLGCTFAP